GASAEERKRCERIHSLYRP
ncbi:hypothetical protein D039_2426B, partial [Vibrio parahaemolyticus EKP-028]